MQAKANTGNITIVLNRPKYSGNVGSVARCAKNMGIHKIAVVNSQALVEEEMIQMSTHCAADLVSGLRHYGDIREALSGYQFIVGTTSRLGSARGPVLTPREVASDIVDISQNNSIALLFGSEDKGLSNEDLRYCHRVISIPTSDALKSINLSHAVMIVCYEIFTAQISSISSFTPKLAMSSEIEGMYTHLKTVLTEIGFLNPENPDYWMMHIRRFMSRTKLLAKDVRVIRGICRQIDWYIQCYRDAHKTSDGKGID
jgi:tRNA/rRNA methyltransferase